MALGRPLMADDDNEGGTTAAVISYRLWERAFGLDPAAAGKTIYINRKPYLVVGVTAREFFGVSVTGIVSGSGNRCDAADSDEGTDRRRTG